MIPNVFVPGTPSQRVDGGHDGLGGQKGMPGLAPLQKTPGKPSCLSVFSTLEKRYSHGRYSEFFWGGAHQDSDRHVSAYPNGPH